jgi:YesN/AraC family two-component response regulator
MVVKIMPKSSQKILVIADDPITRNLFLDSLNAEGFAPLVSENGVLGIQAAQVHSPDLVICDLLMSDRDGSLVLNTLRRDPLTAKIPFIFLTTNNFVTAIRQGMELGVDDYLIKPATVEQLLRAIAVQLEKQAPSYQNFANKSIKTSELTVTRVNSELFFPSVPHLKEVFDYIESHYHEGITLSDVAEAVGYSSAYLTNQVAKQTGDTVNNWIVKRRMAAARPLLKNTNLSIEEIATKLGYQNSCHFSRQFRQHHNLSPTGWRKQHQFFQVPPTTRLQFLNRRKLADPVSSSN